MLRSLGRTGVSSVTRNIGFGAVQQLVDLGDIRHVGGCPYQAVHQPRRGVDTNVGFHPEVPLIAFLGLMHFRITLALTILDRRRRGDQGSVDDSAFFEQQSPAGQMLVNRFKEHPRQLVRFQQAAKSQQGGGIRCRLAAQVDAHKTTDGLAVVDGIFGTFIGETETLLHDIHTQHARQPNRRAPALACGVAIKRSHLRLQLCPGHQLFKVSQETISASLLFLAGVFEFGEGLLHARNKAHGKDGWLKVLSVPRVGDGWLFLQRLHNCPKWRRTC